MLAARCLRRQREASGRPGWLLAGLADAADVDGRVIAFGPAARAFLLAVEASIGDDGRTGERGPG